ncbi:MAG: fused MFS/spermidine synthase [Planctomycetota bacterium]|jgi:predicted MFS family arabinose efflux permease
MGQEPTKKADELDRNKLHSVVIIGIACVCGWFIMELEILGIRALAPYFGSAVYVVMGSVIGVFLLSLAAGYMVGGWLSRKTKSKQVLGINLMAAGAWMCGLPFFIEPVCDGIFNIGLDEKWGSLLAALILFGVPTVFLGTVSPAVVRWLTKRVSDSGLNTGLVLAFSTVASFAGSVVTAFYLILLSIRYTLCVSGIILAVLGGIILLHAVVQDRKKPIINKAAE